MIAYKARLLSYQRNSAGRNRPYTKACFIDLTEIEYMEADEVPEYGDCVIVRLRSGKEMTVVGTIDDIYREMQKGYALDANMA